MIRFDNNGILIQSQSELPQFRDVCRLYADFETTSGDKKLTSLNPWHTCYIAGLAITHDANPNVYYVPREFLNLEWLSCIFKQAKVWTNHNVKYDAHVLANNCGIVIGQDGYELELDCTLTGSKLVDSDRLASRDLATLSLDWLHTDISRYEAALQPYLKNNKDYGNIPIDKLGEYACQDVITNRQLAKYIDQILDIQASEETLIDGVYGTNYIRQLERDITRICFEIERNGMDVIPQDVLITSHRTVLRMIELAGELRELTGREVNPGSNKDMYDLLIVQYGLPVVKWTENEGASFDKHAMAIYEEHVDAPKEVIEKVCEFRKLSTFKSLFLDTFLRLEVDGKLHSTINQIVRTGRMSASEPNSQQQNELSKELIIPPKGYTISDKDYSQIEFRKIVHYIIATAIIKEYNENPDTDYHTLVAETCHIHRKPAKTVNFMVGYGGGKKKTIQTLSTNRQIAEEIDQLLQTHHADLWNSGRQDAIEQMRKAMRVRRGTDVYNTYHATLPTLKPTAKQAERIAYRQGYVRTWYGRRRHLPQDKCWLAFNTVCQGSAADLLKERLRAYWQQLKGAKLLGTIKLIGLVHDSIIDVMPTEIAQDERYIRDTLRVLEFPARPLRVPVRCTYGFSEKNWREAAKQENKYPRNQLKPVDAGEQLFTWV